MKAITAPINRNSPGEAIANLQDALQMCLDRGAILGNDPNARQSLFQALRPERETQSYGRATVRVLSIFQRERNHAMVILPDHLHVLWTSRVGDCDYPTQWMLIKTGFSRQIPKDEQRSKTRQAKGERGIRRRRYWEQRIRDDRDFARHADCIRYDPVRHGYVERVADLALFDISSRSGTRPYRYECERLIETAQPKQRKKSQEKTHGSNHKNDSTR